MYLDSMVHCSKGTVLETVLGTHVAGMLVEGHCSGDTVVVALFRFVSGIFLLPHQGYWWGHCSTVTIQTLLRGHCERDTVVGTLMGALEGGHCSVDFRHLDSALGTQVVTPL